MDAGIFFMSVVSGAAGGGIVTLIGRLLLDSPLKKLEAELNTQTEAFKAWTAERTERIKAGHAKHLQMHAVQFQKQYLVYERLYRAATKLEWQLSAIMPVFDRLPDGKNWIDVAPERMQAASKAIRVFMRVFQYNEPFVPDVTPNIYDSLMKATNNILATIEVEYMERSRPQAREEGRSMMDAFKEVEAHLKEFKTARETLKEIIASQVRALYEADVTGRE